MTARIRRLAEHVVESGAHAVLFTCSSFRAAIDAAATVLPVPAWKPNQAMFESAISLGARICTIATSAPGHCADGAGVLRAGEAAPVRRDVDRPNSPSDGLAQSGAANVR